MAPTRPGCRPGPAAALSRPRQPKRHGGGRALGRLRGCGHASGSGGTGCWQWRSTGFGAHIGASAYSAALPRPRLFSAPGGAARRAGAARSDPRADRAGRPRPRMSAAHGARAGRAAASGGAAPRRGWRPLGHGARDGGGPASSHGRSARSVGRPMSLRLRINLVITLVTVAFTLAMAYEMVNDLRSSVREEIESTTRVAVQLVETVVAGAYLEPGPTQRIEALLALLRRVGRVRGNDIRFYDGAGAPLYESPAPTYRSGKRVPEWFNALVRPEVAEARFNLPGGSIVVTPDASRSIVEAWDDLKNFTLLALAFLVLVNAAVFWLLNRALKPLPRILEALTGLTHGRFHVRLPRFHSEEFDAISRGFNRMAQALEESLAQNRQLALVAQQSSDGLIISDLWGGITYCNAPAERLLGYAQRELVGSPAFLIAPPERRDELRGQLESIGRRASVDLAESQRVTKSGRLVDVALSAAPLVDPAADRVIGEICSMRDITEHKRMQAAERELEQNRKLTALIQSRLEDERRAIARELHDELAQCVTAIKTIGTAIAGRAGESKPDIRDNANTIVSVAAHIYDVVHGIIRRLRPSGLDDLGLAGTLRDARGGRARPAGRPGPGGDFARGARRMLAPPPGGALGARALGRARGAGRSAQHHR